MQTFKGLSVVAAVFFALSIPALASSPGGHSERKDSNILLGDIDSDAKAIHDRAVQTVSETWRRTFLIANLAVLTMDERHRWFLDGTERYAVVGGAERVVADRGTSKDLLTSRGQASAIEIWRAFARGDAA